MQEIYVCETALGGVNWKFACKGKICPIGTTYEENPRMRKTKMCMHACRHGFVELRLGGLYRKLLQLPCEDLRNFFLV